MISLMRASAITGWRRRFRIFGKPDFVFPKSRIAVFVDGDFWHGHPTLYRAPQSNSEFWEKKIRMNKARDRTVKRALELKGWRVFRVWESTLKKTPNRVISRLKRLLNEGAL